MQPRAKENRAWCAGFSMVEMLVAIAILTVIVMLLSMLFQQTSLAWRTGLRRADSFMQVRTLLGAIQRDASAAVDQSCIPQALRDAVGGGKQNFSGGELKFYTLTGSGFEADDPSKSPRRALKYITYTQNKRTESVLTGDGGVDSESASLSKFTTLSSKINLSGLSFDPDDNAKNGALPAFVTVNIDLTAAGESYDIGAASAGPDRKWGTDDDIRTWTE